MLGLVVVAVVLLLPVALPRCWCWRVLAGQGAGGHGTRLRGLCWVGCGALRLGWKDRHDRLA